MQQLKPIGVQLYTLRNEMERDFEGTLKKMASLGFREIEFAGYFGRSSEKINKLLSGLRLKAVATHIPFQDFQKNLDSFIEETAKMNMVINP